MLEGAGAQHRIEASTIAAIAHIALRVCNHVLYNACAQEDVDALVECMQDFEKLHK